METKYSQNEIVWAKLGGYPWWPSYVKDTNDMGKTEVVFLGEFNRAILKPSKIKKFKELEYKPSKCSKDLNMAIESALRILQKESTLKMEFERANQQYMEESLEGEELPEIKEKPKKTISKHSNKTERTKNIEIDLELERGSSLVKPITRFISAGNAPITKRIVGFVEKTKSDMKIKKLEEELDKIEKSLKKEKIDCKQLINNLEILTVEALSFDNKSIFKSKLGQSFSKCLQVCVTKLSKGDVRYEGLRDCLQGNVNKLCEHLISRGFLKEREMYLDCINMSKRNSIFNSQINEEPPEEGLITQNKLKEPQNNIFKMQDEEKQMTRSDGKEEEEEVEEIQTEPIVLKERVQFRVKKKLAKVIYLAGGKEKLKRKGCEEISLLIEGIIHKESESVEEYKDKVVTLVKMLDKNTRQVKSLIQGGKKDFKIEHLKEHLKYLLSN